MFDKEKSDADLFSQLESGQPVYGQPEHDPYGQPGPYNQPNPYGQPDPYGSAQQRPHSEDEKTSSSTWIILACLAAGMLAVVVSTVVLFVSSVRGGPDAHANGKLESNVIEPKRSASSTVGPQSIEEAITHLKHESVRSLAHHRALKYLSSVPVDSKQRKEVALALEKLPKAGTTEQDLEKFGIDSDALDLLATWAIPENLTRLEKSLATGYGNESKHLNAILATGSPRSVEALVNNLDKSEIRDWVVQNRQECHESVLALRTCEDEDVWLKAAEVLERWKVSPGELASFYLSGLSAPKRDYRRRRVAFEMLSKKINPTVAGDCPEVRNEIINLVKNPRTNLDEGMGIIVRKWAKSPDTENALAVLFRRRANYRFGFSENAIQYLAESDSDIAADIFCELAQMEGYPDFSAIYALSKYLNHFSDERASLIFAKWLNCSHDSLRISAAKFHADEKATDADVADACIADLAGNDTRRYQHALKNIDKISVPEQVRTELANSLDHSFTTILSKHGKSLPYSFDKFWDTVGKFGDDDSVDLLVKKYPLLPSSTQNDIIEALGISKTSKAADALVNIVSSDDSTGQYRAWQSLVAHKGLSETAAIDLLRSTYSETSPKREAFNVVGSVGGEMSLKALQADLQQSERADKRSYARAIREAIETIETRLASAEETAGEEDTVANSQPTDGEGSPSDGNGNSDPDAPDGPISRSWVGSDGVTVEGKLIDYQRGRVHLNVNGRIHRLSLNQFSDKDRKYITKEIRKRRNAEPDADE